MARNKISSKFRDKLSEKLMDLGNLTLATLALGQFVTDKKFSWAVFGWGVIFMLLCYLMSYIISSEGK
ncbi:hypothetical protein A3C98_04230 [Candidatus Roizmanbacteria bacterium RIFCSPHIGHO2_02_FULL_37_15]|uniref:Uncharacterized protein n=1 Tax=Candidatus Roizmanbacteria bacterium RIFCSPLOWO2_01_FULL_37_16 TaxID=1802058 RepID=A0A1F7IP60_9BACT|nr:MAG: hypothetical protein A3C98_04230 [Candidatus Roizmanbacteria bacterium RIFCSPHIGHO2_02_FULL_37_15]OGK31695.1 MAG: hypothetical protein A3F57_01730 [Candidatus Roizmanbacteria bacterium RIFCSPHIGHO2_12_FULL_36_11]OGK45160.1 MAG: hypothetical protein A3B40_02005 [Candidatus Roizmanbacteria bacterium RIFCSPLOWO2_01_FULL_37_16]